MIKTSDAQLMSLCEQSEFIKFFTSLEWLNDFEIVAIGTKYAAIYNGITLAVIPITALKSCKMHQPKS